MIFDTDGREHTLRLAITQSRQEKKVREIEDDTTASRLLKREGD